MKKISVVIPIYNTQKYLSRCLKSICEQTYTNLEIICVDDGSSDGSEKIVDEFANRDARIKVVHQENKGESNARNVGLKMASGDYIAFCDCDDWIELDMYEHMIDAMESRNVDLVACGYFWDDDVNSVVPRNRKKVCLEPFDRKKLFEYVYIRDEYKAVTSWIWCKLYRKELMLTENEEVFFDENINFGADLLFFLQIASKVKRAFYIDKPYYHYYQRISSTAHSKNLNLAFEIVNVYEIMIEFCYKNDIESDIIPWLKRFWVYRASLVAEEAYRQKNTEMLIKCKKIMNQEKDIYLKTNEKYPERITRYYEIMNYNL